MKKIISLAISLLLVSLAYSCTPKPTPNSKIQEPKKEKEKEGDKEKEQPEEPKSVLDAVKGKYKGTTITEMTLGKTDPVELEVEIVPLDEKLNTVRIILGDYSSYMNPDNLVSGLKIEKANASKEGENTYKLVFGESKGKFTVGKKEREYTIYEGSAEITNGKELTLHMKYTHNRMPGDGDMLIKASKIK